MKNFGTLINLTGVNFTVGPQLTMLGGEYVMQELYALANKTNDVPYDVDPSLWLRDNKDFAVWLYEHVDFFDEVSDPFSLDEMYESTAESLEIAIEEIRVSQEYTDIMQYLTTHKDSIQSFSLINSETFIIANITR